MSTAIGLSIIDTSLYIPELRSKRKDSALQEMLNRAIQAGAVRDPALLRDVLSLRERLGSTAIGKGVAVPQARSLSVMESRIVVARSRRGVDWGSADGLPVLLVLLVLSPAEQSEESHHDLVARAVAVGRLQRNRQKLIEAGSFEAVASVLREITG
jgi:mannitol/fructose-specific phosphotransferase system IIA component (Ntr-type)